MTRFKYILSMFLGLMLCQTMSAQSDRQFIRNGNRFFRQQNYDKAEIEYRKALERNSGNAQAMYNLGTALLMQQKDSAAIQYLQEAGRAETAKLRKAKAYHNIGVICQNHRLYGEAIQAYEESLRCNPNDNETRYNLALCKREQKKQQQNKKDQRQQKKQQGSRDKTQKEQKKQDKTQENRKKMSKDNAQQLLNYAEQEEKATQQRLNKNRIQPQRRRLEKNW